MEVRARRFLAILAMISLSESVSVESVSLVVRNGMRDGRGTRLVRQVEDEGRGRGGGSEQEGI